MQMSSAAVYTSSHIEQTLKQHIIKHLEMLCYQWRIARLVLWILGRFMAGIPTYTEHLEQLKKMRQATDYGSSNILYHGTRGKEGDKYPD